MITIQNTEQLKGKGIVLTMGFFDGVHLGHKALSNLVLQRSKELGLSSAILTFWPHPRFVLNKDPHKLRFLTTLKEKSQIFSNLGVDYFIIYEFTQESASLSAESFIKNIVESYNVKHFIIGKDHRFGKNAGGSIQTLAELSSKLNFTFEEVGTIEQDEINISSTKIREALINGELDKANRMLGYPYTLTGIVEEGSKIGRQIGFPTANIKPIDPLKLIPAFGVYAVLLNVNGKVEKGMMNIGIKPTIDNSQKPTIEVNIFDFSNDIYHHTVEVAFIARLRDEKKFNGIEQLKLQLENDKLNAYQLLNDYNPLNFTNYFIPLSDSKE